MGGGDMDVGPELSGPGNPSSLNERTERLVYLADMLRELQDIAAREGCVTLAGLLALSHVEAQRQSSGTTAARTRI